MEAREFLKAKGGSIRVWGLSGPTGRGRHEVHNGGGLPSKLTLHDFMQRGEAILLMHPCLSCLGGGFRVWGRASLGSRVTQTLNSQTLNPKPWQKQE